MQEGGEEMMTKNAVQQIEEAEHKAKEYQALAVEQAKKLLSDAERQGQAALEQALREAEAQRREQDTQAEQAAQLRADAIMTEARRACDDLRRQAEERLADAAALIVRRVVGDSCLIVKMKRLRIFGMASDCRGNSFGNLQHHWLRRTSCANTAKFRSRLAGLYRKERRGAGKCTAQDGRVSRHAGAAEALFPYK